MLVDGRFILLSIPVRAPKTKPVGCWNLTGRDLGSNLGALESVQHHLIDRTIKVEAKESNRAAKPSKTRVAVEGIVRVNRHKIRM